MEKEENEGKPLEIPEELEQHCIQLQAYLEKFVSNRLLYCC